MEQLPCEGSDSGVEMNSKCCHCQSTTVEVDSETDSCQIESSTKHSSAVYFNGDMSDLVASTIRKLNLNGEHSQISYDAASENGSESSSIDDSKKCKSNCANVTKLSSYCAKSSSRRQMTPSSRSRSSPFANDSLKLSTKPSSVAKCISSNNGSSLDAVMVTTSSSKTKLPVAEVKNRGLRSCSVTRSRTPITSPDELKWPMETRLSGNKLMNNGVDSERTAFDTYATLPRRKQREISESRNGTRDPSLNRAASLRKKFLENSIMSTSMNAGMGWSGSSSSSSSIKTLPPYMRTKPVKTKIYHEVASQTSLTNTDVDQALSNQSFSIYNDMEIQVEAEYRIKKRYEEQMKSINDELKKLKKENGKQRTVIEWLEGELSSAKDEKSALKNKYNSVEERIYSLLMHKGSSEDVFHQLEREVSSSNNVISKQQDEIAELQQMVCMLKRDLDKSYSTQKTILETQKASEVESLELQEFLQAEKVTLTDSLRDIEQELTVCRARLIQKEQELAAKQKEHESLEQTRQQNQSLKVHLCKLERRCRDLLLHQGAVISSASVALSGLGSRFDQLLDQLVTAYNISDDDLRQDESRPSEMCTHDANKNNNECYDKNKRSITDSGRANLSVAWLKAIRGILFKTSSTEKQDCKKDDELKSSTVESKSQNNAASCEVNICSRRNDSTSNFNPTEDLLYLSKINIDSRRNSVLSDMYLTDENLTLDVCVNDSLENVWNTNFLKDFPSQDVSLVEQVIEVDKQVTKVLKALLITAERSMFNEKNDAISTNNSSVDKLQFKTQNGTDIKVPENASTIAFLRLQQKTVTNLLSLLRQMPDVVDGSTVLKKIQNDLEDVDRRCDGFLASVPFDTAV